MEFGYWQENERGLLVYTSLSKSMPVPLIEDEHFWNILKVEEWIIFQSLDAVYLYNTVDDEFKKITVDAPLTKAFEVTGEIYFQALGSGLYKIVNAEAQLVNDSPLFKNEPIVQLFENKDSVLLATQNRGIYELPTISAKEVPKALGVLDKNTIYSAIQLKDGRLAIGTIANGLYLLDDKGELLFNLNQSDGLANNTVLSLLEDDNNNLWLGLDNGICNINLNSAFGIFKDHAGRLGTVYASYKTDKLLYLGTNQGLFFRPVATKKDFKLVPGTSGQVWMLKKVANTLFCGHNSGTFVIIDGTARLISNRRGTWDIHSIPGEENKLLQGTYDGLYLLSNTSGSWQDLGKLSGFDISSRFFEFTPAGDILVNHEYKGVFLLHVNDNFTKVLSYEALKDLKPGFKSGLVGFQDKILYAYSGGIKEYTAEKTFTKVPYLSKYAGTDSLYVSGKLVPDTDQRLWAFTRSGLAYFEMDNFDNTIRTNYISLPASTREDMRGFENISSLGENKYLLGAVDGYLTINLDKLRNDEFKIALNKVKNGARNEQLHAVALDEESIFKSTHNNFNFSFSLPIYQKYKDVYYQYRLKGFDNDWENWTSTAFASYDNLPHGDYTFEVRGRVGDKRSANTEKFSFTVNRPWYLSVSALVCYAILSLIAIILIHYYNRSYYRKKERNLKIENEQKLALERSENKRKLIQVEHEKLENNFKSKSRELAASAMSVVKKNELLNGIKDELNNLDNNSQVQSVIRTIDKNLDHNQDWEFFEEAFTNADKDFFKKVKAAHPKLTPKDLKLCAYLRLNLTSKEIAPLLNISVRSLEIKRYRLRKKMNLPHEKSLVEYILSF